MFFPMHDINPLVSEPQVMIPKKFLNMALPLSTVLRMPGLRAVANTSHPTATWIF
jgi:hypothetical protein